MIALRPYQDECIEAVRASARRGVRRQLISLPTGTGKTVVFSAIIQAAVRKGSRCIVLAHRDELLSQTEAKLLAIAPELAMSVGYVKGKLNDHHTPVVIASVQTLSRAARIAQVDRPFDLVIVDEAHHVAAASYQRVLSGLRCYEDDGPLTIGVTATPQRADGKGLDTTFQEVVYHRDMLGMIRDQYLCDLRGVRVKLGGLDLADVRTTAGDFNEGDLEEALEAADAPEHGVRAWHKYCAGRKTICFTPTIALAESVAAEFRKTGVNARALSGKTPLEERRYMLRAFASGKIQVIANAQVLTEGFDEPTVDCVMIARPTKSQGMYVQMVGRGTRLAPGKKDAVILDIVGATDRLDLLTLPRLFGQDEDDDEEETQKVDDDTDADASGSVLDWAEREEKAGKITARTVELFSRQDIAWVRAEDGLWVLAFGSGQIELRASADKWDVLLNPKHGSRTPIAEGLDQGYAMGAAEDYARNQGAGAHALVSRNAQWRTAPASDKQVAAMRRLKISVPDNVSRGEASDQLAAAIARLKG